MCVHALVSDDVSSYFESFGVFKQFFKESQTLVVHSGLYNQRMGGGI